MRLHRTLLAAATLASLSAAAGAVDWEGYVRVGPGQKQSTGADRNCFNGLAVGGHGGVGRLGNECETYGEFALSQTTDVGGVKYKALLMSNFYNGGSEPGGNKLKVNQIYIEGSGYDIAPNQTFWIGKRFYGRADVHFDDTFFVDMSGTGAGIDGINPGFGVIGVSVFRNGDNTNDTDVAADQVPATYNSGTRLNIDWAKMPINPGGQFRVTGVFTRFSGADGKSGAGLSLQHVQEGLPTGATNTAWLQFSQGSAGLNMGFGNGTSDSDTKGWRIADSIAWLKGPITGQTLFQYGQLKSPDGLGGTVKTKFYSVGGRGVYAVTNNFKLLGELATSSAKPDGGKTQNVTKLTIGPALTVGQDYYSRPELRAYVSHFRFNDAYRDAQGVDRNSKTAVGLQAEVWF